MDYINIVINLIKPNEPMVSIFVKDSYFSGVFSGSMDTAHEQYLKFILDVFLKCTCMSNEYRSAMRNLVKISRVHFGYFGSIGQGSVAYVDIHVFKKMHSNLFDTILDTLMPSAILGFVIYLDKLVLNPSRLVDFVGFLTSSKNLADEKEKKINTSN